MAVSCAVFLGVGNVTNKICRENNTRFTFNTFLPKTVLVVR